MKTSPILLSLGMAWTAWSAQAQNVIQNGSFESGTLGGPPPKPWAVSTEIAKATGISVTLEKLPNGTDDKLWLRLHDENPDVPSGTIQNFPEVKSGRFTAKLYFQKVGTAFGIYLGAPKVSAPETRVVDFKVLQGGKLTVGNAGPRARTTFAFGPDRVYPIFIDIQTNEETKKVSYQIGLEDSGEVIASAEVDARMPIAGLRLATDSKDKDSDVYITDISLVPKP